MKLHQDRENFRSILNDISSKTGCRQDVLEKDYYIVLVLKELAEMQQTGLPAYFKGGTALYKALRTINRFSEDIDLSVETRDCNRSQNDKRLEKATKKYTSMSRDSSQSRTNRSEVISMYTYEPVVLYNKNDALQRFGNLKVEATSFTISEPVESLEVSALLYDWASDEQKRVLESIYDVKPFKVQTITIERIFIDKLFAAEAYVRAASIPQRAFEASKHIYDLAIMEKHPRITELVSDPKQMEQLLAIRMTEELQRLDGIPCVAPAEFTFFSEAGRNTNVRNSYEIMLNRYVIDIRDRIEFNEAASSLLRTQEKLQNNLAWRNCHGQAVESPSMAILNEDKKHQSSKSGTMEIFQAQADRAYLGEILDFQDDIFLQEISPGVTIGHDASALTDVTLEDIGKHLTIAYDRDGVATVSRGQQLDQNNGIER